jgi:hypothetical protein
MGAACRRIASVHCAGVVVVADDRGVNTPFYRIARVGGASIVVVAADRCVNTRVCCCIAVIGCA